MGFLKLYLVHYGRYYSSSSSSSRVHTVDIDPQWIYSSLLYIYIVSSEFQESFNLLDKLA